jgi:hypothetical protein
MEFFYPNPTNIASVFSGYEVKETPLLGISYRPTGVMATAPPPPAQMEMTATEQDAEAPTGRFSTRLSNPVSLTQIPLAQSTSAAQTSPAPVASEENVQESPPDSTEMPAEPLAPVTAVALSDKTGESHMDLYKLLKRPQPILHVSSDGSTGLTGNSIYRRTWYIPVSPQYSDDVSARASATDMKNGFTTNYLQYFSRLAFYWRGALEYRVVVHDFNKNNNLGTLKASFLPLPYVHLKAEDETIWPSLSESTDFPETVFTRMHVNWSIRPRHHYQSAVDLAGFELEQLFQQGTLSVTVPYVSHTPYRPIAGQCPMYNSLAGFPNVNQSYIPCDAITGWLAITY